MRRIGICNNKGGEGETTISLCLAGALAENEAKVLLIDMDQQGSLSSSFLPDITVCHCLSLTSSGTISYRSKKSFNRQDTRIST